MGGFNLKPMLVIGSNAVRRYYPDFPREPKDVDYVLTPTEYKELKSQQYGGVEFHLNPVIDNVQGVASPELLLTLKLSHVFWDIQWNKHVFDIVFLFEKGNDINIDLFWDLYRHWEELHGKNQRSDLTLTADEFFNNALKEHDHDYLHTIINPTPTYFKVLHDNSEVEPSEEKFNALSHEDKLALVREEVYVMAYERMPKLNHYEAYQRMLKKFIMAHAPMWEVFFILKNYRELHKPLINYQNILNHGLNPTN